MKPPLKVSTSCSLLKVEIAFAAWAVSPRTKVSAVGPVSSSASRSSPAFVGGDFGQAVLDDAEAGVGFAQFRAQLGSLRNADAAVVDSEDRLGSSIWAAISFMAADFSSRFIVSPAPGFWALPRRWSAG